MINKLIIEIEMFFELFSVSDSMFVNGISLLFLSSSRLLLHLSVEQVSKQSIVDSVVFNSFKYNNYIS